MTDEEKLQKYLPLIRNAAGWTAEDLGTKIGLTKQTISNLENQKTRMSKTQYLAIQMVISQKIATTPDDLTLANVMKLVMDTDEDQAINYDAIPQAMAAVERLDSEAFTPIRKNGKNSPVLGAAVGSAVGGIAGAMSMLGLGPVGAVSAAILGATIAPWLTKALNEKKEEND